MYFLCVVIIYWSFSGAQSSGDIDIILSHPDHTSKSTKKPPYIRQVVRQMETAGFVTDTLSLGESKFMVNCYSLLKFGLHLCYIKAIIVLASSPGSPSSACNVLCMTFDPTAEMRKTLRAEDGEPGDEAIIVQDLAL